MLSRRTIVQTSLAVGTVAGLAGIAMYANWRLAQGPEPADGWWPMAWPFPRDGWPPGRAWRGHDLEVYVRPKLGFCGNCDTGVVTDDEVDRVTDIDLLDEKFDPLREGSRVRITDLFGRARLYRLANRAIDVEGGFRAPDDRPYFARKPIDALDVGHPRAPTPQHRSH